MANEQVFKGRAEHYAQARPGYAEGVTALLFTQLVKPGDRIADVGSGTGIFSGLFISRGFDVYCVEPNGDMRAQAESAFSGDPHFISVAATAENTGLPDGSVDLVTAASAFHWFDAERFAGECRRILKPDGLLFTVANGRDYSDPFTLRQHELCQRWCKNFTSLRHGLDKAIPRLEKLFGADMNLAEFDCPLSYTKEKFVRRSLSSSYAPEPDTEAYRAYTQALWALLDEFAPGGDSITVPNVSVACWGTLR